ncbi:MAG: dienelactone hydrolase family protein [Nannocystaceae bacterium]
MQQRDTVETLSWTVDDQRFSGHAVWRGDGPKPAVLVCHAWAGQGDFERGRAAQLAALGYVGVAVDVYGEGKRGASNEECRALMLPLVTDRGLLRRRLLASVEAVRGLAVVDGSRVAAIGFCFGGLCAFDLARSGAALRGVIGFHGLFTANPLPPEPIRARVLALHGYDDPMAKPEALIGFCDEMRAAGADFQVHVYGGTMHAFTNPQANDPKFGTVYSPRADARSRAAMEGFLAEVFAD